jgi:hypothetical protein
MNPFSRFIKETRGLYTVEGSECTTNTGIYGNIPLCVMVHPYNGHPSTQLCADIDSVPKYQSLKNMLDIKDTTPGKFTFSVQTQEGAYKFGVVTKEPCALKPQWAFLDKYNGSNTNTSVECWTRVFTRGMPAQNVIYFKKSNISFHGPRELHVSPNTHILNFLNDDKSRCIAYYVKYLGPVLSNQVRAGLIMLYNEKDQGVYDLICNESHFGKMSFMDLLRNIPLTQEFPQIKSLLGI